VDEYREVIVSAERTVFNAWERLYWLWDVLHATAFAGTMALVLVLKDDISQARQLVAVIALSAIAIAYLAARRKIKATDPDGVNVVFGITILTLAVVAMFASSTASFILFSVCPMLYMSLPSRPASVLTVLMTLLVPVTNVVHNGLDKTAFATLLPITAFLIVFGLLVGWWANRIIDQSRERAELITKLEASQAEVARLSHEAGTAAERERLAREIHDTLAQGFTSIVALTQAIESELDTDSVAARRHLVLAARTARENLAEARSMVAALTPSALTAGSLEDAVRRQAERLGEESAIAVSCAVTGPLPALGMPTEVVLLRATQEALTNVRKHARASAVDVRLSVVEGSVRLSVTDDGVGFDPDLSAEGFGLHGMRARAGQVGGTIKVHSGHSKGTTVELEVPA
jgi:signal transduction histidine kinase